MSGELSMEEIEKNIEARVEIKYIRKEIEALSQRVSDHMDNEELERDKIYKRLNLLTIMAILQVLGIPALEFITKLITLW